MLGQAFSVDTIRAQHRFVVLNRDELGATAEDN
jgi:hypothetical protein